MLTQNMQEAARWKDDDEVEPLTFPPFLYGTGPSWCWLHAHRHANKIRSATMPVQGATTPRLATWCTTSCAVSRASCCACRTAASMRQVSTWVAAISRLAVQGHRTAPATTPSVLHARGCVGTKPDTDQSTAGPEVGRALELLVSITETCALRLLVKRGSCHRSLLLLAGRHLAVVHLPAHRRQGAHPTVLLPGPLLPGECAGHSLWHALLRYRTGYTSL